MPIIYRSNVVTVTMNDTQLASVTVNPAVDVKRFMRTFQDRLHRNAVAMAPQGEGTAKKAGGHLKASHRKGGLLKRGPYHFETSVRNVAIYARTIHEGRPLLTQANLKNATKWATPVGGVPRVAYPPSAGRPGPQNWRVKAQAAEIARGRIIRGGRNPHVVAMMATRGQHAGSWIWLSDTLAPVAAQPWLERAGDWTATQMRTYRG